MSQDPRDSRDPRDNRDPRDSRDPRDLQRPQYPPQEYAPYPGGHNTQHSPHRPDAPRDDSRSSYPPPDPARQGQYPPGPGPYPPPQQWAGQHPGAYPPPPPHHYDPNHAPYPYPPPPPNGQASQPLQPDPYRLPPPYPHPHPGYYPPQHYQAPPAPAPRQRTAIACKYCRKRKIRCSGYDNSPSGRCANCVRFNQQCLFHPVSSQAAFVPASAVYGPAAQALAGQGDGRAGPGGQNGETMLYGAHGQPLGPAGPSGQPQYGYPPAPQGYAPQPYAYPPPAAYPPPVHSQHYDPHSQGAPPPGDRNGVKRGPPDDDPHNEESNASHSPHPTSRARHAYDGRTNSSNGNYDHHAAPTSPATSTMSYQSYARNGFANGSASTNDNNSPPSNVTPPSSNSFNSPRPVASEGRTTSPGYPNSTEAGPNGRNGMSVANMLGGGAKPHNLPRGEQRGKNDNDMLSKLDGKRKGSD